MNTRLSDQEIGLQCLGNVSILAGTEVSNATRANRKGVGGEGGGKGGGEGVVAEYLHYYMTKKVYISELYNIISSRRRGWL